MAWGNVPRKYIQPAPKSGTALGKALVKMATAVQASPTPKTITRSVAPVRAQTRKTVQQAQAKERTYKRQAEKTRKRKYERAHLQASRGFNVGLNRIDLKRGKTKLAGHVLYNLFAPSGTVEESLYKSMADQLFDKVPKKGPAIPKLELDKKEVDGLLGYHYRGSPEVHITPNAYLRAELRASDPKKPSKHAVAMRGTLLHEWAHAIQKEHGLGKKLEEGGAEAWSRDLEKKVWGKRGPSSYPNYERFVRRKVGRKFIAKDQFK